MTRSELAPHPRCVDLSSVRALVAGRPGAGKGTQCRLLNARLGIPHVSTGDILRDAIDARTPLGRAAGHFVAKGHLVPDRMILHLLFQRLGELATGSVDVVGYLLDGVPRTIQQAEAVAAFTRAAPIDAVVHLSVPDEVARARIHGRGRSDDGRTTALRRLDNYEAVTVPMLTWLAARHPVIEVDANRGVDDVASEIVAGLARVRASRLGAFA